MKKILVFMLVIIELFALTSCARLICTKSGHTWKSATCTSPKRCIRCNQTDGESIGHKWVEDSCMRKCSICDEFEKIAEHELPYGQKCGFFNCTNCGKISYKEHEYNSNGVCIFCGERQTEQSTYTNIDSSNEIFWDAITAAQVVVKEKLKSPSSAKFPTSVGDYTVKKNGDDFIVTGHVDAENGFGATLRQKWNTSFTLGDELQGQRKITNYTVTFS